jgi:hypothetical protein
MLAFERQNQPQNENKKTAVNKFTAALQSIFEAFRFIFRYFII